MPRSRMLWSAEPVKWMRYVPASPGGMTMRSTCGPRRTVIGRLRLARAEDLVHHAEVR